MFSFFTDPYPNEYIYSVIARFLDRGRFPQSVILKHIWGKEIYQYAIHGLYLQFFLNCLPEGHIYQDTTLVANNTLFRLHYLFATDARRSELTELFYGTVVGKPIGNYLKTLKYDCKYLKICPACAVEDLDIWGEFYWHQEHQPYGVEICIKHKTVLGKFEIDPFYKLFPFTAHKAVPDEAYLPFKKYRAKNVRECFQEHLLEYCQDIQYILENDTDLSPYQIKAAFAYILNEHFSNSSMPINERTFTKFFSQGVLKKIDAHWETKPSWLGKSILNQFQDQHYSRNLLLIRYLGYRVPDFLAIARNYEQV